MATISTHNGSAAHRDHNIRNRNVTDKQPHIDRDGHFEIWHDERLPDAYERIFGDSVKRYNERQQRPDRQIRNYLQTILQDARKHAVYEMIVGVYGKDVTPETQHQILKEFVDDWQRRNPNLVLVGAYYHADEAGDPHVHIDYVPVAHGYKRGMDTQTGLARALYEQGFSGKTKDDKTTSQIKWQARENQVLERICNAHGIEVDHPQRGKKAKHLDTEIYKKQQQLKEVEKQLEARICESDHMKRRLKRQGKLLIEMQDNADIYADIADKQQTISGIYVSQAEEQLQNVNEKILEATGQLAEVQDEVQSLEREKNALTGEIEALRSTKKNLESDIISVSEAKEAMQAMREQEALRKAAEKKKKSKSLER